MKLNNSHFIGGVAILLWVVLNIGQPNFGFYPMETIEQIGYNFGHIVLLIIGAVFLISASRKKHLQDKVELKQ